KPDGSNLQAPHQRRYWQSLDAKSAFEQYKMRQLGVGNVVDVPLDENALQNLASADIEGVFCMYTDDLKDFYTKAQEKLKDSGEKLAETGIDLFQGVIDGQPVKYSEKLPEGPGWIVELRGHTYNKNLEFVKDTLVYNIN